MFDLHFAARSDLGLGSKTRNEDSAFAGPNLLLLCDGMGGHAGGDTASAIAVHHLAVLDNDVYRASDAGEILLREVAAANEKLRVFEEEHPETRGMGTTCIAMVRSSNSLAIAHIGDSRAYRLQDGELSQITHDHSFLQLLIDEGHLTEEEAWGHPQRSLITRVLSGRPDDEPDHGVMPLVRGDRFLLCSDGLSDYVRDDTIAEILRETPDPEDAVQRLLDVARRAGTRDNVTVVVADVVQPGSVRPSTPQMVGAAARLQPGHEYEGPEDRQVHTAFREPETPDAPTQTVPVAPDGSVTLNGQHLVIGERAFTPRTISREGVAGSTRFEYVDQPAVAPGGLIEVQEETGRPVDTAGQPRRVGGGRLGAWLVGGLATLALLAGGLWWWADHNYFVGEREGQVQIRRGFDAELAGQDFSALEEDTHLAVDDLPSFYADSVRDAIPADGLDDARRTVEDLRQHSEQGTDRGEDDSSSSTGSSDRSSSSAPSSSSGNTKSSSPSSSSGKDTSSRKPARSGDGRSSGSATSGSPSSDGGASS
ncbi:PP2C family protein-serine/threonine phosphatase [Kytococcus sp. Marseille-QA3725]